MTTNTITPQPPYAIEIAGLEHHVPGDAFTVMVSNEKPLLVEQGKFTSIRGESAVGKTTLLSILGLLRKPKYPDIEDVKRSFIIRVNVDGEMKSYDILSLWRNRNFKTLEELRCKYLGFALQSGELMKCLTVRQNIEFPMKLNGISEKECHDRVEALLEAFDLREKMVKGKKVSIADRDITFLSGGEKQRVNLARAISHRPQIIFVDEPTASLDKDRAVKALNMLEKLQQNSDYPITVIMITHDEKLAREYSHWLVFMEADKDSPIGRVVDIKSNNPHP